MRQGVVVKTSDYCQSLGGHFVEVELGYRDRVMAFCCAAARKFDQVLVINGMALIVGELEKVVILAADLSDLSDSHRNILADIYHDQEIEQSRKKVDEIIRLSAIQGIEL